MSDKIYRFYGIDTALDLLRPGAKYSMYNDTIIEWDDPRPIPTKKEIRSMLRKIKKFEDSFETIWLPEEEQRIREVLKLTNTVIK